MFRSFSLGVGTNRDPWIYNYSPSAIEDNVKRTAIAFAEEQARFKLLSEVQKRAFRPKIRNKEIKWTDRLAHAVSEKNSILFDPKKLRSSVYRPYSTMLIYFDHLLNQRRYQQHRFFPTKDTVNVAFCATGVGAERPFAALAAASIPDLNFFGPGTVPKWFPFYTYDEDGTNRRENITDWALAEFRTHYGQKSISKRDIFHYTYALLHHPEYRTRYAANLKRELPRIPFAPDFASYARIGAELMKLHLEYEGQPEYPLQRIETGKLDWNVEKMTPSKDKTQLRYNGFLTLSGIPPEVYEYRLGNRSALEWVVDQYRVSTDNRSGIVNDPNRPDDPEFIVRLIGQVITVSVETVRLVKELAKLALLPQ